MEISKCIFMKLSDALAKTLLGMMTTCLEIWCTEKNHKEKGHTLERETGVFMSAHTHTQWERDWLKEGGRENALNSKHSVFIYHFILLSDIGMKQESSGVSQFRKLSWPISIELGQEIQLRFGYQKSVEVCNNDFRQWRNRDCSSIIYRENKMSWRWNSIGQ